MGALSGTLVLGGVSGVAYGTVVLVRARRQTGYEPVSEDWVWYVALPCVVYVALIIMAVLLRTQPVFAPFGVAAVALSLLLIGIHNAWDTVTHLVVSETGER